MNLTNVITKDYGNWTPGENEKNKPNSNPNKPNSKPISEMAKMNVNPVISMNYQQRTMNYELKNKPNSNPIKANSNPILANKMQKQTQTNPISKAKTIGFYGYFLARDRHGGQGALTVYGKSEFIYLWLSAKMHILGSKISLLTCLKRADYAK